MKKISVVTVLAALLLLLNGCVENETTDSEIWQMDYNAAVQQATAENKYILMDFSGSDWCGWCIKLDDDVFSKQEFVDYAQEHLVSVLVDFPRTTEQSPEQEQANKALAEKYKVEGFPTVLILNPKGELVARTGYIPGDANTYIEHIESLIEAN